jgi:hypothetical protein
VDYQESHRLLWNILLSLVVEAAVIFLVVAVLAVC